MSELELIVNEDKRKLGELLQKELVEDRARDRKAYIQKQLIEKKKEIYPLQKKVAEIDRDMREIDRLMMENYHAPFSDYDPCNETIEEQQRDHELRTRWDKLGGKQMEMKFAIADLVQPPRVPIDGGVLDLTPTESEQLIQEAKAQKAKMISLRTVR